MIPQTEIHGKVKNTVIIYAVIIFIGILLLAAGHFLDTNLLFYGGLILTLAGVLLEIVYIIAQRPQ